MKAVHNDRWIGFAPTKLPDSYVKNRNVEEVLKKDILRFSDGHYPWLFLNHVLLLVLFSFELGNIELDTQWLE